MMGEFVHWSQGERKWKRSRSVVSDSLQPHGLQPIRLLRPWDFPGKSAGVGCHFLLQRIFTTQESNLGLPRCRQTLYHLNHQGGSTNFTSSTGRIFQDYLRYFLATLGLPRRAGPPLPRWALSSLWWHPSPSSLRWLLSLQSTSSRRAGFSSRSSRAPEHGLSSSGAQV